jgi:hypothetical protein
MKHARTQRAEKLLETTVTFPLSTAHNSLPGATFAIALEGKDCRCPEVKIVQITDCKVAGMKTLRV